MNKIKIILILLFLLSLNTSVLAVAEGCYTSSGGYSWRYSSGSESCDTVCAGFGGIDPNNPYCTMYDPGCEACLYFNPGASCVDGDMGEGPTFSGSCNASGWYAMDCAIYEPSYIRLCTCATTCFTPLAVILTTPYDNQVFNDTTGLNQTLSCEAEGTNGIETITLHVRDSSLVEVYNEPVAVSGTEVTQNFNYTFPSAAPYSWACEACNTAEGCITTSYNDINFAPVETMTKTFADTTQKAWNTSSGSQTPLSPGNASYVEYTSEQYTAATTADSTRNAWHGAIEASSYENLLFKFTLNQSIKASNVKELLFNWVGYDEQSMTGMWHANSANKSFKIFIWNFNSSAWEELYSTTTSKYSDQNYLFPIIDGSEPNVSTVITNYIGSSKEIYFAISGDFYGGAYAGSCPYLFLSDGNEYKFHTDLMGAPLAKDANIFKPEYYNGGIYSLGDFTPVNGTYKLKVRETIEEADYFDEAKLILVDTPKGYEVMNNWSLTSLLRYSSPKDFVTIKDPKNPISAIDKKGNNVLEEITKNDGIPVPLSSKDDKTSVIVDFGNIERPENAKLILTEWSYYVNRINADKSPYSMGTTIEMMNDKNEWVVKKIIGRNGGFNRSLIFDVSDILEKNNTKMRITLYNQPTYIGILDQVMLDDSVPVDINVTYVDASVADLGYAGATNYTYPSLTQGGSSDDAKNPVDPKSLMYGNFTKYGDVKPLLEKTDDKFVIMASGDELALEFKEPEKSIGAERHAFLYADVFYSIKSTVKKFLTDNIYPLPFHGMKTYSYPEEQWKYRWDSNYREYLDTWNTRTIEKTKGTHTMYENSSQLSLKYIPEYASSGTFTSNKINLKQAKKLSLITFTAETPVGTTVKFQIRSADTNEGLDTATWLGPDGTGETYYTTTNQEISSVHGNPIWAQWKAYLSTTVSTLTPKLTAVDLVVKNKVDETSWATFITGNGTSTVWSAFTPVQYLNGGNIDWYYSAYNSVEEPCSLLSEWTLLEMTEGTGQLGGVTSNYLCLRALMHPDENANKSPEITSMSIGVQR
ncbi:MAG: hypothetical protein WC462_02060 [archaeon]